jgi:hypothetical protein
MIYGLEKQMQPSLAPTVYRRYYTAHAAMYHGETDLEVNPERAFAVELDVTVGAVVSVDDVVGVATDRRRLGTLG